MKTKAAISELLIAPCGMNCGLCMAYQREKKHCPGCNVEDENKPVYCIHCKIKNCEHLALTESGLCVDCEKFPCARMKQLDKRYRTRYGMSMIENLRTIQSIGKKAFVKLEMERWKCPQCGGVVSVHRDHCFNCGEIWRTHD